MTVGYKIRPYNPEWKNLDAQSVDETAGAWIPVNDCRQVNWLLKTSAGVSAGTVVFESKETNDPADTTTPNQIDSMDCATLGASAEYGQSFPMPPGGFIRTRISDPIVGGTVTTFVNGLLQ